MKAELEAVTTEDDMSESFQATGVARTTPTEAFSNPSIVRRGGKSLQTGPAPAN